MNWKGHGRKRSWPNLWYYLGICLEELRKSTKASARIAGLRAEILNYDLPNTNQECQQLCRDFRCGGYLIVNGDNSGAY
jgi:hypothetical protein